VTREGKSNRVSQARYKRGKSGEKKQEAIKADPKAWLEKGMGGDSYASQRGPQRKKEDDR